MKGLLSELIKLVEQMRPYVLVSALLLIATILFTGSAIQFISSQGSVCSNCHEMKEHIVSLQKSKHKSVSCMECHKDLGYLSFFTTQLRAVQNLSKWFFRSYNIPIITSVENETCLSCHNQDIKKTIVSKSVRISHKEFSSHPCTGCHGAIAHEIKNRMRNYPSMESCFSCHRFTQEDNGCLKCHPVEIPKRSASDKSAWGVVHGSDWKKTHGMGDQNTCVRCHKTEMCEKCHINEVPHPQPWSFLHAKAAKQNIAACYGCHYKNYCTDCHLLLMPHPEGFLKQHANIVEEKGYDVCWRCHAQSYCTPCHVQASHTSTSKTKFKFK